MSDGITLGIAGAGKWGGNHVTTAAAMGVLGAICDADPTLLGNLWSRHPDVKVTTRFEDLLAMPVDAVVIATPAQTHATLALKAIEAGKHVFIEKPLALTVEDAQNVAAAAKQRDVKAFVGHLVLYQPGIRAVLERVRCGSVGEVQHIRARRASFGSLRFVEDVWWSFAPHDVSAMLAIMGDEPLDASMVRHDYVTPGIADFAYADFKFPGGRSAHIEATWLDPGKGAALDVFGTNGTLSLRDVRGKATLRVVSCGATRNADGRAELWRGDETVLEFDAEEPLRTELECFIGMILRSEAVPSDADSGIKVVRALSMCAPQPTIVHELYERMPA